MAELRSTELRLPGEAAQHRQRVAFTFEGQTLTGYVGEPIAAALHANGVTVLSRSFKYRRPRGLHCMAGSCPNCAMRVDGLPGVTTCETPLRGGEVVERERGWPSADRDLLEVLDVLSPLTPNGFQYRWFRRHQRVFDAVVEPVLRRLAARADLPDRAAAARLQAQQPRTVIADVAVIGGGVCGMRAALAAAAAGASVTLIDRGATLGGAAADDPRSADEVSTLIDQISAHREVNVRSGATAFAWFERDVILVVDPDAVWAIRASCWTICTGGYPQALAFPSNDLPGVMLGRAVRRLVFKHDIKPGHRVVVVTDGDHGHRLAVDLEARSVTVAAIADIRLDAHAPDVATAAIRLPSGHTVMRAHGRRRLTGVTLAAPGDTTGTFIACDVLCIDLGTRPADELPLQLLSEGSIRLKAPTLDALRRSTAGIAEVTPGVWLAGGVTGADSLPAAAEQGEAAGRAAANAVD